MAQKKVTALVERQEKLSEDVYSMWIREEEMAAEAKPGQFLSVYCKAGGRLLPRPISICEADGEMGILRIVYRIIGDGTREFSKYQTGDSVEIMGPLGNGFPLEIKDPLNDGYPLKEKGALPTAFLIGGGIGIPPLLELAKRLNGRKEIFLGYRDQLFLQEEFMPFGRVSIATEDGSAGTKGNVLSAIKERGERADVIFACGPTPMQKAVQAYAASERIACFLSLEERMACGVGACLACVCKTREADAHSGVHNARICKDGPVFRAEEVEL